MVDCKVVSAKEKGVDTRYSISIIHCPIVHTPGGAASFEHVACMLSLQRFNQNYSNLLVFSYTTVYAVVRTDGKGS